ncbi:MAG: nucleotide sugar dehydrogenase [Dehalococcoidia bacterium]|nr:nucleotide sugar dehydrogenase [Dehalococcoidia bacterium]
MNIAVVGAGRIGLPLSVAFAQRGHNVVACDINAARVDAINRAENPIPDEAGLAEALQEVIGSGACPRPPIPAAPSLAAMSYSSPSPSMSTTKGAPTSATCSLPPMMSPRVSTPAPSASSTPRSRSGRPGREILPRFDAAGRTLGSDVFIAFSPERLLMGRVLEDIKKYPSVVGGLDAASGERAAAFYAEALGNEVLQLASAEAAELSKLAEGVYRDLNIALANELARVADVHGIDINEVARAANSQPYCHIHVPGTGVGGHCIPVYPRFLVQGEGPSDLAALGRNVNDAMPAYAAERVEHALGGLQGEKVVIMGLTFRPNVAVTHHTNALDLKREFEARGAVVAGHDPLLSDEGVRSLGFEPVPELSGYDVAVVHAWHRQYADLDLAAIAPLVLDARNAFDRDRVEKGGARYMGIGRPLTGATG